MNANLSTPIDFIECFIPTIQIDQELRDELLSLSALKSCYCMLREDFLDTSYSIIAFACILHTAEDSFQVIRIVVIHTTIDNLLYLFKLKKI